jgi:hypothetical protein
MKMLRSCFCLIIPALLAGCGSLRPVDANKWAADFYRQQTDYKTAEITFAATGGKVVLEGVVAITLRNTKPPLSVIPKDPGVIDKLCDLGLGMGRLFLAGYGIHEAGNMMSKANEQHAPVVTEQLVPVAGVVP